MDNFSPCEVVTVPDRSYDICIDEVCRSPGCGTAICNAPGPHFPIPDTNQRLCYSNTELMTCPETGEEFHGQDAQYGWDTIHEETDRFTRDLALPDEPVVIDNLTGLMWQGCPTGNTGSDCQYGSATSFNWQSAVASCDALDWGGFTDWHLPDEYELHSIVDAGRYGSAIDPVAFPYSSIADEFWTSSSFASHPSSLALTVYFYSGTISNTLKTNGKLVRCVRGGPFSSRHLLPEVLEGDRVVTDTLSGRIWQGCAMGQLGGECEDGEAVSSDWQTALAYCEGLEWGGHDDWRLPDRKELVSILDHRVVEPCIETDAFPESGCYRFWSSTTRASSASWAVTKCFMYVGEWMAAKTDSHCVRCVRGDF